MTRWLSVVVFIGLATLAVRGQQQEPASDASVLAGQVLARADGRVLAGAHIELLGEPGRPGPTASTDSFGRFVLQGVTGPRAAVVRKAGFVALRTTLVPDVQTSLTIDELAVLAGRVVDDVGEPVVDATIRVQAIDSDESLTTTTDDRGDYRVSVPPTQPVVIAVETQGSDQTVGLVGGAQRLRQAVVRVRYFPGTAARDEAQVFRLEPGESRVGLDVTILTEETLRQSFRGLESVPTVAQQLMNSDVDSGAVGIVRGRATDTAGRGLASALVLLAEERARGGMRIARTDAGGAFEFTQVPAGTFRVVASKPGYAPVDARPTITEREPRPPSIDMTLTAWASVSGRVVNEFGEPVQYVRVQVMRSRYTQGRHSVNFAASADPLTDEFGRFRVFGLEPGTYAVTAELADPAAGVTGFSRSYYDTGSPTNVTVVPLQAGQDIDGIDVRLVRAPAFTVSGRSLDASGSPSSIGSVMLLPSQQSKSRVSLTVSAQVAPDGSFTFTNVRDGEYVLQRYRGRLSTNIEGEFGALRVTVNGGDVSNVSLTTSSGSTVSGTVVLDAADPARVAPRAGIELAVVPADVDLSPGSWARAGIDAEWRFALAGITGLRRLVPTRLPDGWALKAIRVGGVDVGDRPMAFGTAAQSLDGVEIVLTDRPTNIGGRVTDARGTGVATAAVFVFSAESSHWYPLSPYLARVMTRVDGAFVVNGLPAGTYYVAVAPVSAAGGALASSLLSEGDDWQDPDILEGLRNGATVVTLVEAQRATVQLRR